MSETNCKWVGSTLTVERYNEVSVFERVELTNASAHYFIAADGDTYAISNNTALCVVEAAMRGLGVRAFYTTFALKNRTPATCKAWAKKWGHRTDSGAKPDYFSASVRFSPEAFQTVNS